ncbi:unnamed protein product [Protopolystoma xenopodis]|uniref:Uncharacterized protein n=1 Tax=Protopolystoma xenopodis TaxID=117903 RepID=A0A448WH30_9PLAT|nr:unnamed protein product [Protopolystoma xenopodis]
MRPARGRCRAKEGGSNETKSTFEAFEATLSVAIIHKMPQNATFTRRRLGSRIDKSRDLDAPTAEWASPQTSSEHGACLQEIFPEPEHKTTGRPQLYAISEECHFASTNAYFLRISLSPTLACFDPSLTPTTFLHSPANFNLSQFFFLSYFLLSIFFILFLFSSLLHPPLSFLFILTPLLSLLLTLILAFTFSLSTPLPPSLHIPISPPYPSSSFLPLPLSTSLPLSLAFLPLSLSSYHSFSISSSSTLSYSHLLCSFSFFNHFSPFPCQFLPLPLFLPVLLSPFYLFPSLFISFSSLSTSLFSLYPYSTPLSSSHVYLSFYIFTLNSAPTLSCCLCLCLPLPISLTLSLYLSPSSIPYPSQGLSNGRKPFSSDFLHHFRLLGLLCCQFGISNSQNFEQPKL